METSELISKEALGNIQGAKTCIIATIDGFYDSLSVAPAAYALGMPVYLTTYDKVLASSTIKAIKAAGFTNAVIVGGKAAVKSEAVNQLAEAGIATKNVTRLGGANAWETSNKIADWGHDHGMTANYMGAADGTGYWDALTGAALCGAKSSVLVLIPRNFDWFTYDPYCIDNFVKPHADEIENGYVFGGTVAVPDSTLAALDAATK